VLFKFRFQQSLGKILLGAVPKACFGFLTPQQIVSFTRISTLCCGVKITFRNFWTAPRILLLLLLSFAMSSFAQIKMAKPRVFVRNEMIPDAISLSADLQLKKSEFIPESNSGTANVRLNRYNLYALPLVIISNEKMLMIGGGSYGSTNIKHHSINQPADKSYHAVTADMLAINNFGEKWYTFSYLSCGSFSDRLFAEFGESTKMMALLSGGYKWNENLSTGLGAVYFSNFNDPQILPSVRVSYSPENWLFYIWFPSCAEMRYLATENLHFLANCTINSEGYYDTKIDEIIKLDEIKPAAGFQYRLFSDIWLKTMVVYANTEFKADDKPTGRAIDQWRVEIKLSYVVSTK